MTKSTLSIIKKYFLIFQEISIKGDLNTKFGSFMRGLIAITSMVTATYRHTRSSDIKGTFFMEEILFMLNFLTFQAFFCFKIK